MQGNWGKILKVDLGTGEMADVEIPERIYRDFLGGSGLAARLFFDARGWEAEPLSPENPLMIMLGPLSGLSLPGVSRLEICARSPLTGIWGESCMGGHFAPQLKGTGYDGIIFVGASEKPVYLYLTEKVKELRDASGLWGKDIYKAEELLKQEAGDKRAQVISIGPAGENLVRFANVMNDRGSAAGRCGMGAVMGSKKLKAVVARGKKKPPLADEEEYKAVRKRMSEAIKFSPVANMMGAFGTNSSMDVGMATGDVPVKNWREAYWDEGPEKLGSVTVNNTILKKTHSCYGCPIGCKRIVEIREGQITIEEGPGCEYEAAVALGTLQRISDLAANQKANETCNRYGIDVISMGGSIAYATEAFENGLITEADTGGIKLGWNQPATLLQLIELTGRREGFGDILAEGSRSMSRRYGGEEYAMHVKGLEIPMHDPRSIWGMSLTYATSIRGACHVSDTNLSVESGVAHHKDLGQKTTRPYKARGKAEQTIASQAKGNISNSAVICQFAWGGMSSEGETQSMVDMLNCVTGFGYSIPELIRVGDRMWNLKRAIGNLCGATRLDDRIPRRVIEPHPEGITTNVQTVAYPMFANMGVLAKMRNEKFLALLNDSMNKYLMPNMYKTLKVMKYLPGLRGRNKALAARQADEISRRTVPLDSMLDEYYRLRDIDADGKPSSARLKSLGLGDVAEVLHGARGA